jgi:hypothetical protein
VLPEPGATKLAGESFKVIPLGWPEAASAILALNPPPTLTLMPAVALVPLTTVIALALVDNVKLGRGVIVRLNGRV